jgi:anti-anti-sigma factor
MDFVKHISDNVVTLEINGKLSAATAGELEAALEPIIPEAVKGLVLDFKGVSYVASAGLRVLVSLQKKLSAGAVPLSMVNVCEEVREVFEVTGLDEVFAIK